MKFGGKTGDSPVLNNSFKAFYLMYGNHFLGKLIFPALILI